MALNLPYVIRGTIYQTGGTTAVGSGVRVTARNESNAETTYCDTNSSGQYLIDLANLASGYLNTDNITVFVTYETYEASDSFLISASTHNLDLTLASTTASQDTDEYCTVQHIWDELGDATSSDVSASRVVKAIQRAEAEINERTGTKFVSTTVTDEIYAYDQYNTWKSASQLGAYGSVGRYDSMYPIYNNKIQLKKYPVISITALYRNTASATQADSWSELTQQSGSGGDFLLDTTNGILEFVDDTPYFGPRSVKVTYVYGYATVPKTVERLTILLTVKDIIRSKTSNSQLGTIDSVSLGPISIRKGMREAGFYFNSIDAEIESLWEIVGKFSIKVV